jgi:L-lactate dehydrogenase (cytochrome)
LNTTITNVDDLRRLAKRRLPRSIFDYVDGGSYEELTLTANRRDLDLIPLRQRVAIDVKKRSTATRILGEPATIPVAIAPTGLAGLVRGDGEILLAQAAERFGVPFTLSTVSVCSIEDVAQNVRHPFWFQLYMMRDRGFSASLIERARAASCSTLVLTLDLVVQGQRRRDIKNLFSVPVRLSASNILDVATKPGWALSVLRGRRKTFGNLQGFVKGANDVSELGSWIASQFDPSLTWADVEWVRQRWGGKLILKGILDPEDARIAAKIGCDAIVVSNHGGRQLDGAVSSIRALTDIVDAIGSGNPEVLFDGGLSSGQDIMKALASGAHACLTGRSVLYGLGAMGASGVTKVLHLMPQQLDVSMALVGVCEINQISPRVLYQSSKSHGRWAAAEDAHI